MISNYQCECDLYDGSKCTRSARYEIDGIKLCTQHAGPIAIIKPLALNCMSKLDVVNPFDKDPLCVLTTMYDWRRDNGIGMFTGEKQCSKN